MSKNIDTEQEFLKRSISFQKSVLDQLDDYAVKSARTTESYGNAWIILTKKLTKC